jgi:uroporphyrin-III C-methyltransferase/precorrin-2 dehydrogenase/sirohydrochlorin ferrochelatase
VLVVGGGDVAERKIRLLRAAGARVTVIAPQLTPTLARQADAGDFVYRPGHFVPDQVSDQRLVIAATGDHAVNRAAAAAADARGIWVNVVDHSADSSCIVPAIVDRSPLLVAISSGGTAPMLARSIRARIEMLLDESLGRLGTLLARWREPIVKRIVATDARRRFYEALLSGPVPELVRARRDADAERALQAAMYAAATGELADSDVIALGKVILVGAGPGDPGLLTLHALRALQQADVLLHDRLVSVEVLALARRDAELVSVGKEARGSSVAQQQIHTLLAAHARAGRCVVRLKGGDPLIFGRGGEELEFLRREGIPYEIVPGITAAVASAAYAGIPLTHRRYAHGVRLLTAHHPAALRAGDWRSLASTDDTIAVYMGVAQLSQFATGLVHAGRAASTPVALIENASRVNQRVLLGDLSDVALLAARHRVRSPTLLLVGDVTALAESLHWFGDPPIANAGAEAAA